MKWWVQFGLWAVRQGVGFGFLVSAGICAGIGQWWHAGEFALFGAAVLFAED